MGENGKKQFSLDDILEEQRKQRENRHQKNDTSEKRTESPSMSASDPETKPNLNKEDTETISTPPVSEKKNSAEPSVTPKQQKEPSPAESKQDAPSVSQSSPSPVKKSAPQGREQPRRRPPPQQAPSVPVTSDDADKRKPSKNKKPAYGNKGKNRPGHPQPYEPEVETPNYSIGKRGERNSTYEEPDSDIPVYEESPKKQKKKKKRGFSLFGRKKEMPDFDENEDAVYGLQLKPIDEYREGFNSATGEFSLNEEGYAALFNDSKQAIDVEVEKNFQDLQRARRSRVAQAVKSAGVDEKEIEEELGFIAPMPVSSFTADPYTKQHGTNVEGVRNDKDIPEFQKAQLDSLSKMNQTMEIKLNVLNDTVELQKIRDTDEFPANRTRKKENTDGPLISEDVIDRIVETSAPPKKKDIPVNTEPQMTPEVFPDIAPPAIEAKKEEPAVAPKDGAPDSSTVTYDTADIVTGMKADKAPAPPTENKEIGEKRPAPKDDIINGRHAFEIPMVDSSYEYRSRGVPTHVIKAEPLQDIIAREFGQSEDEGSTVQVPLRKTRKRKANAEQDTIAFSPKDSNFTDIDSNAPPVKEVPDDNFEQEAIEDYTSPEDAKAISNDLRTNMHDLSLRIMITGICTVVLAVINVIFGRTFSSATDGAGSAPFVYTTLTLLFLGIALAVCFKTILNGLSSLFTFNANSDSAVAIAAVGVLIQTASGFVFSDQVVSKEIHYYAVVLIAALFINAIGKLTMIRRIHSNFRFVSSKDQKYTVQLYSDHNTAVKMVKNNISGTPVIAYQAKAGFLKKFLEYSFRPDPSEATTQMFAPIGLITSLILCLVTMIISGNVATGISAFSAALIACIAFSNMLCINLPMSRLSKLARRAGSMIVGYEAVDMAGDTNTVMVDADELFPKGTVVLNGIKTYATRASVEYGVLSASSLVNKVGGPLTGVFEQVINENEGSLPEVEKYDYEDGGGISGWVDGQRVFIGNRKLMLSHKIQSPALDDETQFAIGNKQVVYIAVDSNIIAMMIVTYEADRRKRVELQRLEENGVSILVRTTDANITPDLMTRLFSIDRTSIIMLTGENSEEFRQLTSQEVPRADAIIATKGRIESLMTVISACVKTKKDINFIVALQTIAVILGFVMVAFVACFGVIGKLGSFGLALFEFAWVAAILLVSKLRSR